MTPPFVNTHDGPFHYVYDKLIGMRYIVRHASLNISVGLYSGVRIAVR